MGAFFGGGKKKAAATATATKPSGKQPAAKSSSKIVVEKKGGTGPIPKGANSRRVVAAKPKAAPRESEEGVVAAPPDEIDFPAAAPEASAPISPGRPASKSPITASRPLEGDGDLRATRAKGPSRTGDAALGEFLTGKAGLVSAEQLDQMKAKAVEDNTALDAVGVTLGIYTEEQLVNALTQECWVPHLKVDKYEIRKKALDTITSGDAIHFGVFPVDKLGSLLTLAMVNPLDLETIRVLEAKTSLDIKKVVATRSEIVQGIEKYYSGKAVAKEGSLGITQDVEPKSVTQMLAGVTSAPDRPAGRPSAPMPSIGDSNSGSEIQDIDDLLAGDDAVAPAIVEPISLSAGDIEVIPEEPAAPMIEDISLEETSPVERAASPKVEFELEDSPAPAAKPAAKASTTPEFELDDILSDAKSEPEIATPEAEIPISRPAAKSNPTTPAKPAPKAPTPAAKPAPKPAPRVEAKSPSRPATSRFTNRVESKPGITNLVPVMEEEFQHAITHGKSHVFDKWVGLQSRNRIINAVVVEREVEPILASVYASPTLN